MIFSRWIKEEEKNLNIYDFNPETNLEDSLILLYTINFNLDKEYQNVLNNYIEVLKDYEIVKKYNYYLGLLKEYHDNRKIYITIIFINKLKEMKLLKEEICKIEVELKNKINNSYYKHIKETIDELIINIANLNCKNIICKLNYNIWYNIHIKYLCKQIKDYTIKSNIEMIIRKKRSIKIELDEITNQQKQLKELLWIQNFDKDTTPMLNFICTDIIELIKLYIV